MGFLSNALDALNAKANDNAYWSRFSNKNYAEAIAGLLALVCAADGEVQPEEEAKIDRFIQIAPELAHFDKGEIKGMFKRFVALAEFTPQKVHKELRDIKDQEQRQNIWDIGFRIAAIGKLDASEERVLREVAEYWNIDVSGRFA